MGMVLWRLERNRPAGGFCKANWFRQDGTRKQVETAVLLAAVRHTKALTLPFYTAARTSP